MSETRPKAPRCFVIGANKIAIRCCEILLQNGFNIRGVISDEETLRLWSLHHRVPIVSQDGNLCERLTSEPFEFLFSIFNTRILPRSVLELPLRFAVNYHDALLPTFAGLHAPAWALINREAVHGITWHKIDSGIDTGDILKQGSFSVEPSETSLTLNQRCFEEAVISFAQLVPELKAGSEVAYAQDLKNRTYFAKHHRPSGAGLMQWNRSAAELEALIRALDFGPFENPLALPKVFLGDAILATTRGQVKKAIGNHASGTIIDCDAHSLTVATADEYLVLTEFKTLQGGPILHDGLGNFHSFNPGDKLEILQGEALQRLDELAEDVARHESFWIDRLEAAKEFNFFFFRSREWGKTGPARFEFLLPLSTFEKVNGRGDEAAVKTFLLAALVAYLSKMSGESAFDLDYPATDPRLSEFGEIFSSRVPLRFEIAMKQTFEAVRAAVEHEVEKVKKRITFFSDLIGRRPSLSLRARAANRIAIDWLESKGSSTLQRASVLFLFDLRTSRAVVTYDASRVDEEILRAFAEGLGGFVTQLANSPEINLGQIPLVSAAQLAPWHSMAQGPTPELLPSCCVHESIAEKAHSTPKANAVEQERRALTYAELEEQANRLAHVLREAGAGPDRLIAIYLPRSLEMIVAVLGILKAGAAYLPLDTAMPDERVRHILNEARPCALVGSRDVAKRLELTDGIAVIDMDEARSHFISEQESDLPIKVQSNHLAYVIYTSGSSGAPKGVLIEHRSLAHYALTAARQFRVRPGDRMLQFASLGFDASAEEIFMCLVAGATLVLRTEAMIQNPDWFLACCEEWKLTILDLPTAYWTHLVATMAQTRKAFPGNVRLVLIGGERAKPETLVMWHELNRKPALWNTYGPTETTIVSAWRDLSITLENSHQEVPVGRPIPGASAYIMNSALQPVPVGGAGELLIGGLGLARGYLNSPDLTRRKFVDISFSNQPQLRLYRTGDRFRYRPNGDLEFLGRLDEQIKIRGNRVEPGEVEFLLSSYPEISECAVVARQGNSDAVFLACFFVAKDGLLSVEHLRAWLGQRLPDYLIPTRFCSLSRLPLTPNGKIDRRSLQGRTNVPWENDLTCAPAVTATQRRIVAIWESVLRRTPIGIQTNFFLLGGDSLQAVLINVEIEKAFKLQLSLGWIFDQPTVEGLAREVDSIQTITASSEPYCVKELRQIWERVLHFGSIGKYDSIISLGATNADLTDLVGAMNNHYRMELTIRSVTDRPTLSQMAELIEGRKSREGIAWWKSLVWGKTSEEVVTLRKGGDSPPLFIYPGGWVREAELLLFAAMLPYFPPGFPIYGLKQNYAVRACRVAKTLPRIAENFLAKIRRVQPAGPVQLLGECVSWVVVMEMARQLHFRGEEIASVTLLDPLWPHFWSRERALTSLSGPRKVRRYYRILEKGPSLPFAGSVNIVSLEDPESARQRLQGWRVFEHSQLNIVQTRGDHHTYTREHGPEIARLIGSLVKL